MKLKYYLRGLGIGIIVTTIILMISFSMHKEKISDEQIIARAEALGMEFPEDTLFPAETEKTEVSETPEKTETSDDEKTDDTQLDDNNSKESDTEKDADGSEIAETTQETEASEKPETSETAKNESEKEEASENTNETQKEDYLLTIKRGAVCRDICNELFENGLVDDAEALRVYLGNVGYASNISVGKYKIPYGLSYEEIYNILKAGPMEGQ